MVLETLNLSGSDPSKRINGRERTGTDPRLEIFGSLSSVATMGVFIHGGNA